MDAGQTVRARFLLFGGKIPRRIMGGLVLTWKFRRVNSKLSRTLAKGGGNLLRQTRISINSTVFSHRASFFTVNSAVREISLYRI